MRRTAQIQGGAIGGDYPFSFSEKWWYTATCEFSTIPGGTTEWERVAAMQLFFYNIVYLLQNGRQE